jgi:hypothetical protein
LNLDLFRFRASDKQIGRLLAIDQLAESYTYNSPFASQENKFGKGIELEGSELKEFGTWLGNKVDQVLSYTDVDDVTVTVTNFTRSGNAVHIDGQPATGADKVFAAGGLLLPAVSGAAVKKVIDLATAEKRAAKLSKLPRDGKDFTKAGKEAVIDLDKAKNDGKNICKDCGIETQKPTQDKKGVTSPKNRTEVDHKIPKSKGGSGTPDNGEIRCKDCNNKKSDN